MCAFLSPQCLSPFPPPRPGCPRPLALRGCAPGPPNSALARGAPGAAPASSWHSLIHQHSYQISCRKDFFIGCDKNKKSREWGESDQGADGWEPNPPPIFGAGFPFFFLLECRSQTASSQEAPKCPFLFILDFSSGATLVSSRAFLCYSLGLFVLFPSFFLFFLLPKQWLQPSWEGLSSHFQPFLL